jgi:hypothetical protein
MTCFCKLPDAASAAAVPSTKGGVAASIEIGSCTARCFADSRLLSTRAFLTHAPPFLLVAVQMSAPHQS